MKKLLWSVCAGLCIVAMAAVGAAPAGAQDSEVKEKSPMYTYVGNWNIPRAQWAEMEKGTAGNQKILDKAMADGTIVAYGFDTDLVHSADGYTHDDWWSSNSMAGALKILDEFKKTGSSTSPVLSSATKHMDEFYVSRYYNRHSGTWKDAYTHGSAYKFKADAPDNALDLLCKNLFVPLMEKMLVDGTIAEYEIDTQIIHTEAPGSFYLFYVTANAEGLDKVNAAIREAVKANPLSGPAFESIVDSNGHHDELLRTTATFK
jgi:hypothetical protein